MNKNVHTIFSLLALVIFLPAISRAQNGLVEDQNPNYMISEEKYMQMADSINTWHSTTPQETYKAIDFLADKREAREARRAFRREIRLERARNNWNYGDYYYNDYYPNNYRYNYNYYRPYRYRGYGWNNNNYWNAIPLAVSLGWWCR